MEQSPAAKRKAKKAKVSAAAQDDAKPRAFKAEAEAIANAVQEVYAQAVARQLEAQPAPFKKSKKPHFGPRLPSFFLGKGP